jgi:hypothetical protein
MEQLMRPFALPLIMTVFCFAGCANNPGRVSTTSLWSERGDQLGRLAVVETFAHGIDSNESYCAKLKGAIRDSVSQVPSLELVDVEPPLSDLAQASKSIPASEYELVVAAKELRLDTLCLLDIDECYATAHVNILFPIPNIYSKAVYRVRMIDVNSGKLLLQSKRSVLTHGLNVFQLSEALPVELAKDVRVVLTTEADATNGDSKPQIVAATY